MLSYRDYKLLNESLDSPHVLGIRPRHAVNQLKSRWDEDQYMGNPEEMSPQETGQGAMARPTVKKKIKKKFVKKEVPQDMDQDMDQNLDQDMDQEDDDVDEFEDDEYEDEDEEETEDDEFEDDGEDDWEDEEEVEDDEEMKLPPRKPKQGLGNMPKPMPPQMMKKEAKKWEDEEEEEDEDDDEDIEVDLDDEDDEDDDEEEVELTVKKPMMMKKGCKCKKGCDCKKCKMAKKKLTKEEREFDNSLKGQTGYSYFHINPDGTFKEDAIYPPEDPNESIREEPKAGEYGYSPVTRIGGFTEWSARHKRKKKK